MSDKPLSPKAAAMDALRDAMGEAGRKEGARLLVLSALLTDALVKVDAIQELARPRRKAKGPAA